MASLSVRKLDDTIYEKLRIRAARHGVSMEEEARQIISHIVTAPESISDVFKKNFGHNGINIEIDYREPHEPISFSQ